MSDRDDSLVGVQGLAIGTPVRCIAGKWQAETCRWFILPKHGAFSEMREIEIGDEITDIFDLHRGTTVCRGDDGSWHRAESIAVTLPNGMTGVNTTLKPTPPPTKAEMDKAFGDMMRRELLKLAGVRSAFESHPHRVIANSAGKRVDTLADDFTEIAQEPPGTFVYRDDQHKWHVANAGDTPMGAMVYAVPDADAPAIIPNR